MKTTSSLLLQVLVGFILVILWFPSIIYFEYINKDNNDKTSDLNYKIKDYYLKSGKIKKIGRKVHTFDTSLGPIKINKSILSKSAQNTFPVSGYNIISVSFLIGSSLIGHQYLGQK